jgi:hypothetical protein
MKNNIGVKGFTELTETEINDTNGGGVGAIIIAVVGLGFTIRHAALDKAAEEGKQQAYEDMAR